MTLSREVYCAILSCAYFATLQFCPFSKILYFESLKLRVYLVIQNLFPWQSYFNKSLNLVNRLDKRYSKIILVPRSLAPFGQRQEKKLEKRNGGTIGQQGHNVKWTPLFKQGSPIRTKIQKTYYQLEPWQVKVRKTNNLFTKLRIAAYTKNLNSKRSKITLTIY